MSAVMDAAGKERACAGFCSARIETSLFCFLLGVPHVVSDADVSDVPCKMDGCSPSRSALTQMLSTGLAPAVNSLDAPEPDLLLG